MLLFTEHPSFSHLQMFVGLDWEFYTVPAHAQAQLIELAELLGCRDTEHAIPHHLATSLARGAPSVLAAIEQSGGAEALAAADRAAAACLCHGLMEATCDSRRRWLPSDLLCRVERTFAAMGPSELRAAAVGIRSGAARALQHAYTAVRLMRAFLQADQHSEGLDAEAARQSASAAPSIRQVGLHVSEGT